MMLRFAFAAAVLLTAPALAAQDAPKPLLTWPDLTTRPKPQPNATVDYGSDPYQKVDVWVPAGKGPFPTVLMVHGGCWTTSIADHTLMNWIADDLRKDGIAVWNVDYRGVDRPGGGYPGTFADAGTAADALRTNARKFHLDTRRVVAVGHSAGGHLALWLAARGRIAKASALYQRHPLKIAHVISLGGLPDLEATAASPDNGCGVAVVARLVGAPGVRPDVYSDTSVPRLLPDAVKQDLVNGREDKIIPLRMGTAYVATARAKGDRADLHVIDHTGHVELIAPETAAWAEAKTLIRAAFAQ
ncbi:alpha/beta hydrolase [Sphingomonas sp. CARO-RG-8B-R24-01]|uniref:alpha/beta hydrolase family protein n=1 Tax=Sphingomonas sp. CARO-RG-8B-R24-01 TaxID=2914831 RepID=UPI001F5668B8|nr:alpha/beta hydrolase [Sphingomonas sp. CARO-RG-8B-R24-01]